MKIHLFFLFFLLTGALTTRAQNVSMFILELESHTKWEAVETKWNSLRDQWVTNCKLENTPQQSAKLLLQLESYVKWDAVENNWTSIRNAWIQGCEQATSNTQVVKLLLEFESNIKWSAVDEQWKTRRSEWIKELNGISQAASTDKSQQTGAKSAFNSVTIGNQTWMAENLNVDKFRNGDPIPQVKSQEEWETAKMNREPAWWFGTNSIEDYGTTYGKLYNWYAVTDPRGLAPEGWHIPSELEWEELLVFLAKANTSFSKLKSQNGWLNDKNGTNEFGFSALPGGNSEEYLCFTIGQQASWWSTREEGEKFAIVYSLKENDFFLPDVKFKSGGNSVRCIRNK